MPLLTRATPQYQLETVIMSVKVFETKEVQNLLKAATNIDGNDGNTRFKQIAHRLLGDLFKAIDDLDITPDEVWAGGNYLNKLGQDGEAALLAAGVGLVKYLDIRMDAADKAAGLEGGTPRTIEGPLYVEGTPLVESDACLTDDPDETDTLYMTGQVTGPDGEPVQNAILHVWPANSKGFYSHFDPTGEQTPFNNRRRIRLGADGRYAFHSKAPSGYSVPPGGATDKLMHVLGRHGNRPAHVHFFVEAPGYRKLTTQINFGDDPFAKDDFAFGTREGLLPVPNRQGDSTYIAFDFRVERADSKSDEGFSERARTAA
jgi:catechol 1,2-dioxygenase